MAADLNPYAAPRAELDGAPGDGKFQEPRLFSVSGRMGRIRYLSNCVGVFLAGMMLMGALSAALGAAGVVRYEIYMAVMGLVYLAVLVLWFMLAIQRLHDIDQRGGLSMFFVIPFLNILFLFYLLLMPGDEEANRFGPPTPPNGLLAVVIACAFPLLLLGLLFVFGGYSAYR